MSDIPERMYILEDEKGNRSDFNFELDERRLAGCLEAILVRGCKLHVYEKIKEVGDLT